LFFEFPKKNDDKFTFEITAFTKTLYFFDSQIGKLSIQLNKTNLIDRKEWYTLKNQKDENCMMILLSFADLGEKKLVRENSNSINYDHLNTSLASNKSLENKMKISILVNKPKANLTSDVRSNFKYNSNSIPSLDTAYRNSSGNIELKNDRDRSNLLSPPSQRNHNSIIHTRINRHDQTGYLTTHDSILVDQNDWMNDPQLLNDSSNESNKNYKDEIEKFEKAKEKFRINKESIFIINF